MPSQLDIYPSFATVVLTLILYDYALTIAREIKLFWQRPKNSWGFTLFVANRYSIILGQTPFLLYSFWTPETLSHYSRCNSLRVCTEVVVTVIQLIGSVIMAMRVRALYRNSRPILILILVFWFVGAVVSCWAVLSSIFTTSGQMVFIPPLPSPGDVGCPSGLKLGYKQGLYLALAWSAQLVFDTFIFLLTLMRSLRIWRERSRSIIEILLRDGSLYFAIMCAANVANVIVLLAATSPLKGVSSSLTNVISAILISRLMLNLRDPKTTNPTGYSVYPLSHLRMVFAVQPAGTAISTSTGTTLVECRDSH
ncbi:hypothetical protein SCLCIDRAFT_1214447 [Scleroderma citrinum Foug A]|uniref:DUF6533 domain-containing protein n=1 Tax=Scleroderma citrinum Foug A TaxID=1036808 RepID=A0A0C3AE02_9AGAM|nr:hypothetical protein SCLCIDRAFT_1214447 [Scleroderma citrinum Foug A]